LTLYIVYRDITFMRLSLALLLTVLLAGCASTPPVRVTDTTPWPTDTAPWPTFPATVAIDDDAPLLPDHGPLGRGALLLTVGGRTPRLVLEDGRQFRLPNPPQGEGRWGWLGATLSPDGWWLGYRTARYNNDPGYQVRSLADGTKRAATGRPTRWAGSFLVLWDGGSGYRRLDVKTGQVMPVDPEVDDWLATGETFSMSGSADGLSWRTGDGSAVKEPFSCPLDHACWSVAGASLASDGGTVTVVLAFHGGIAPGTLDVKVKDRTDGDRQVIVFDRSTGAELRRATLSVPDAATFVLLVGYRDGEVLFGLGDNRVSTIASLDTITGAQRVVAGSPPGWELAVAGMVSAAPDG
jgi:hypothetical protein